MKNISNSLIEQVSVLTGIKQDSLKSIVDKHGFEFILQNPRTVNATKAQLTKLETLKSFISNYNATEFLKEDVENFASSGFTRDFFLARLKNECEKECFEVVLLNAANKLIEVKRMFEGSIKEAPIYPREIIKLVLDHNATTVIIAHNHPGGSLQPSMQDMDVTKKIQAALATIDVKLLDHIIVGVNQTMSFAEKGLI